MGNGSQPEQNRQHAMDDATGVWKKLGSGRYENADGWAITKQTSGPQAGRWLITRPDGTPYESEAWKSTEHSLSWAKAAVENRMAGIC